VEEWRGGGARRGNDEGGEEDQIARPSAEEWQISQPLGPRETLAMVGRRKVCRVWPVKGWPSMSSCEKALMSCLMPRQRTASKVIIPSQARIVSAHSWEGVFLKIMPGVWYQSGARACERAWWDLEFHAEPIAPSWAPSEVVIPPLGGLNTDSFDGGAGESLGPKT